MGRDIVSYPYSIPTNWSKKMTEQKESRGGNVTAATDTMCPFVVPCPDNESGWTIKKCPYSGGYRFDLIDPFCGLRKVRFLTVLKIFSSQCLCG